MNELIHLIEEWTPVLCWLFIVGAAKVANNSKERKQTRGEMRAEFVFTFFGGILAALTIAEQKIISYRWIIITASAAGGAELLKFFLFNINKVLRILGKNIQDKAKGMK